MKSKNWIFLLLILCSTTLNGQGELDLKLDVYPLIFAQGIQLSAEKKVTKKLGIDLSAFHIRAEQTVFWIDSITGGFMNNSYKSKWFASTLSANIYPLSEKERDMNLYVGPTTRITWATYVDPEYYDASERLRGYRPRDLKEYNPRVDVGVVFGFDAEIFDNIIFEPSFGSTFALSDFIRNKKAGYTSFSFVGWLSIRIAYRFRKVDATTE